METIKLLGICGSPRRTGNTQYLLKQALDSAQTALPGVVETEYYSMSGKTFKPCDACYLCYKKLGHCKIDDDFSELFDKWLAADAVIYAAPVYHNGIPSHMKAFIDRFHSWQPGFEQRSMKVTAAIAQGTGMATGQEQVLTFLNNHALSMGCIPFSGGGYPLAYIGVGGWTRLGIEKNRIRDLHQSGDKDMELIVESTRTMAKRVVQLAVLVKTGAKAARKMLEDDGSYEVFFDRIDKQ